MMSSPDDITQKLMRQFDTEQTTNCEIEWRERDPRSNQGFLNCHPTLDQIQFNLDVPTQSIFPRASKAFQEDSISFWVESRQPFLTHRIPELFVESKIPKLSMWTTRYVKRLMYRRHFRVRQVSASALPVLEGNPI
jgi:hypothetical protein